MINTLNETHLHKSLKTLYSIENEGSIVEAKAGKYIADVLTKEGNVIEIQTGSLSHLLSKCMFYISEKRKVTVVYPLATTKTIKTFDADGTKVSSRKSPKKLNVYSIFRELTSLCPILLDRNFTLEVLEVSVTEERINSPEPVQSRNGRRRFPKKWQKKDKRLDEIVQKHVFHGKKSYMKLFPKNLPEVFLFSDFYEGLCRDAKVKKDDARLMLWVYTHMGLVEYLGKDGRFNTYSIAGTKKTPRQKPRS
ncbi:MAG: hypothetical protein J6Y60_08105 [Treponema sp.]|nr:hypothetical protein [Treponema sp.]